MELFRNANVDWLGKKWYFLGFSLIFSVAGILSMLFWHGIPRGIDFKGGTLVYLKFDQAPDTDRLRKAIDAVGIHDSRIQTYGPASNHEVIVALALKETSEAALDAGRTMIVKALESSYSQTKSEGKSDLDNVGREALADLLQQKDPLHLGSAADAGQRYHQASNAVLDYRDKVKSGLIGSFDELKSITEPAILNELKQDTYLSGFNVRNVEAVGAQVGAQLRQQALLATLYSLAGMLVYLWFRFEFIYGAAAVVAVFHDTLITIGAFSLKDYEITLTVVAAVLTLIGYSMNDTIVVFDRIRENLRLSRREGLADVVNRSINQTLSRTVLTSGLTFLTVLSIYLFGGEVLHGMSFALVVGILIGTYSSIAVAAPMLVAYQEWRARRGKSAALPAAKRAKA